MLALAQLFYNKKCWPWLNFFIIKNVGLGSTFFIIIIEDNYLNLYKKIES